MVHPGDETREGRFTIATQPVTARGVTPRSGAPEYFGGPMRWLTAHTVPSEIPETFFCSHENSLTRNPPNPLKSIERAGGPPVTILLGAPWDGCTFTGPLGRLTDFRVIFVFLSKNCQKLHEFNVFWPSSGAPGCQPPQPYGRYATKWPRAACGPFVESGAPQTLS